MKKTIYLLARDLVQKIESTHRKIETIDEIKRTSKNDMITIETKEGDIVETSYCNVKRALKYEKLSLKDNLKNLEDKLAAL